MEQEANVHENLVGSIEIAVANYLDGKGDLGGVACHAIVHTLKTGDCSPTQRLFDLVGHETAEGKKFKIFLGKTTRASLDNGEHIPTVRIVDGRFAIVKNTHNLRVGLWDDAQTLFAEFGNFLDWKPERKEKPDPNVGEILKQVQSALTKAEKRAKEVGALLPANAKKLMDDLLNVLEVNIPLVKDQPNQKIEA